MAVKLRRQKKTWFNIITPKEFGNYVIGETLAVEPQKLIGRNIKANLMSILNDPRKQSTQLIFKIKSIRDKNAVTEVVRYEILPSHVRKKMRKGKNEIEDSFATETKDKIKVRIKPFMITRTKVQRSKLALIRKITREIITEKAKTQDLAELINDAISTKMQRELKEKLSKIQPLALCEFRMITRI